MQSGSTGLTGFESEWCTVTRLPGFCFKEEGEEAPAAPVCPEFQHLSLFSMFRVFHF